MRTTVTLERGVERLLRTAMKEQGLSFQDALNAAVRLGLSQAGRRRHRFVQRTFSLGSEQSFRWDKARRLPKRLRTRRRSTSSHEYGTELHSTGFSVMQDGSDDPTGGGGHPAFATRRRRMRTWWLRIMAPHRTSCAPSENRSAKL